MLKNRLMVTFMCTLAPGLMAAETSFVEENRYSFPESSYEVQALNAQSTFGTPKEFAKGILDKAKNSVQSRLGSLLANQLFGGLGNSSVSLSDESLAQIEGIVRQVLLDADYYEVQGILDALNSILGNYHENAVNGYFNSNLLNSLIVESNKLISHRLFISGHNPDHYLYVKTYMMIVSLTVAVDTEQYLRGAISKSYLQSKTQSYASKLSDLRNLVVQYVYNSVTLDECRPDGYEVRCQFTDSIKGRQFSRNYYWEEEYQASEDLAYLRNGYIKDFSDGVVDVINLLEEI